MDTYLIRFSVLYCVSRFSPSWTVFSVPDYKPQISPIFPWLLVAESTPVLQCPVPSAVLAACADHGVCDASRSSDHFLALKCFSLCCHLTAKQTRYELINW